MSIRLLIACCGFALVCGCAGPMSAHRAAHSVAVPRPAPQTFDAAEMDPAAPVCTDLDAHVNGKWRAANPIPPDQTRWSAFMILRERSLETQREIVEGLDARTPPDGGAPSVESRIATFYRAAMDEAAIEAAGLAPLASEFARIAAIDSRAALVAYLRDAHARGLELSFRIVSNADQNDARRQIAYVAQGGLGLPNRDYYVEPRHAAVRDAYRTYMRELLARTGLDAEEARRQADAAWGIESRLAQASFGPVEMRDPQRRYRWTTVAEANRLTPNFDWAPYFARVGAAVGDGFSMGQPAFFTTWNALLAEAPLADWRAYARFHATNSLAGALPAAVERLRFEFYGRTLAGQAANSERWKRSIAALNEAMGSALGELYVRREFPPTARARAQALVDAMSAALRDRLQTLPWMSTATREQALAKWATFKPRIGYPGKWRDWRGLEIRPGAVHAEHVASARAFNFAWRMAKVGQPVDPDEWSMTPQTVNAYYSGARNEIVFPAAILQPPFFDANADDAINFGGIGAVIGHEMLHGFDDQGSKYDAQGNVRNWWTQEDRAAFDARAARLVEQFDALEPLPGVHVNGRLTLGENLADLGGLEVAYDALQRTLARGPRPTIDGYTPEQRFFLNFARIWRGHERPEAIRLLVASDPHSPLRYRANAAPSNMPAFAAAFQCPPNAPMVVPPARRVEIW